MVGQLFPTTQRLRESIAVAIFLEYMAVGLRTIHPSNDNDNIAGTMDEDVRIFVSSTFADLRECRSAVCEAIRRLGAIDIAMEHFGSRDARPLDECCRIISNEADAFVGIYGRRYGHIPEGHTTSITEAEYDCASSNGLPRLIYILSEHPVGARAAGSRSGANAKKMKLFKQRLAKTHICSTFSTQQELACQVAADLGRSLRGIRRRTKSPPDDARQLSLIRALRSEDEVERSRAIRALSPKGGPWLVEELRPLVATGGDVGRAAIEALRNIPGPDSANAIVANLNSLTVDLRRWAVFTLGEMALFGRREDCANSVHPLIELLRDPAQAAEVLQETAHSLAKIGGSEAKEALLHVISSAAFPASIRLRALVDPGTFWSRSDFTWFAEVAGRMVETMPEESWQPLAALGDFDRVREPLKNVLVRRSGGDIMARHFDRLLDAPVGTKKTLTRRKARRP